MDLEKLSKCAPITVQTHSSHMGRSIAECDSLESKVAGILEMLACIGNKEECVQGGVEFPGTMPGLMEIQCWLQQCASAGTTASPQGIECLGTLRT